MRPRALIWLLLAVTAAAAARRWLDVVEVRGRSMAPTLLPGDRLLVMRLHRLPRPDEVVLAPDPEEPRRELIKRVTSVASDGVALRGDNASASRNATIVPSAIGWRAILRYWPPSRVTARLERRRPLREVDAGGEPACAFPAALVAGPP